MKTAIISFTEQGNICNRRILEYLREKGEEADGFTTVRSKESELTIIEKRVGSWTKQEFEACDQLIFIGAAGIAVRSIAPCIRDKFSDPAVIVIDEKGQYVIPILSGHVGGANEMAVELAGFLKAVPVITTGTDVNGLFAVDVFAVKNRLILTDRQKAKKVSADILAHKKLGIYVADVFDCGHADGGINSFQLPTGLYLTDQRKNSRIIVDYHELNTCLQGEEPLLLIPEKFLWLGIGCRRGVSAARLEAALDELFAETGICPEAAGGVASIDLKANEEGIVALCEEHQWEFKTFAAEKLMEQRGDFSASEFVYRQTGADNVCERSAVCAAGDGGRLLIRKRVFPDITFAIASEYRRILF